MIVLSLSSICALDLGSSVGAVGFDGEFGYGLVPCYAEYNFWIKGVPQLIKGNTTSISFHFKSGYAEREDYKTDVDYGSITGYMNARFTQGFKHNKYNGSDLYRLWAQYAVRMEQAMPCISDTVDGNYTLFENLRGKSSDYTKGDIDLLDNMKEMANVFSFGVDFPWTIDRIAGTENFNFGARFDYSPKLVNDAFSSIFEVPIDYTEFYVYMNRYHTIYEKVQKKNPNLNKLTYMLGNNMSFRILGGDYIPKFAGGTTYKYRIADSYSLSIIGPHIKSNQTYMYFRVGLDSSFGCGSMTNNWNDKVGWEFDSNLFVLLHFRVFNIFHAQLYCEHEFYYTNNNNVSRFLKDTWGSPSFSFYISL